MTTEELVDRSGHKLTVINYKGDYLPDFPLESIQRLENFVFRDDDILISAYPKSGTHWIWEICRMLQAGTTDIPAASKDDCFIEFDVTDIASMPSPRILNTHVLLRQIPRLSDSACKIVYITRNPRDVAVSFFNHHIKLKEYYHYEGCWEDYLHLFLEGKLDYGSWFDYTRDWEKDFSANPQLQFIHLSYEDMKEDAVREVTKLSQFLGYSHGASFIQSVCDKCDFAKMKKRKFNEELGSDGKPVMYRKGEVGDWANWFSQEQITLMDQVYSTKMAGSSHHVRYTLPDTPSSACSAPDDEVVDKNSNVSKE